MRAVPRIEAVEAKLLNQYQLLHTLKLHISTLFRIDRPFIGFKPKSLCVINDGKTWQNHIIYFSDVSL